MPELILFMSHSFNIFIVNQISLLLCLLSQSLTTLSHSLPIDHLFEGSGNNFKFVSPAVLKRSFNNFLLVLLVHDGLTPESELLKHSILLGSDEVNTHHFVSLVTSQLLLSMDIRFLL